METRQADFDACATEDELLAAIDKALFTEWDGVSTPSPDLFCRAHTWPRQSVLEAMRDIALGRCVMAAVEDENSDFTTLQLIMGREPGDDKFFFEVRTHPACKVAMGEVVVDVSSSRMAFMCRKGVSHHRISLYMRLADENRRFEVQLKRAGTAPVPWFNRYLYHARIAMLAGESVMNALFRVHQFATGCTAGSHAFCRHIPVGMRATWSGFS